MHISFGKLAKLVTKLAPLLKELDWLTILIEASGSRKPSEILWSQVFAPHESAVAEATGLSGADVDKVFKALADRLG